MDTIFAQATVPGKSGVAIIRISGDGAESVAHRLCGSVPPSHRASLRSLSIDGEIVDEALVLFFPESHSFTGEAVLELHTHGSPAVVRRLIAHLAHLPGLRMAEAGEFTRRALTNGRLDLTRVEGLGDLIEAETEAQRRQAMRVFSGDLGAVVAQWRKDLTASMALLMASIDFSDEDLPESVVAEASGTIRQVRKSVEAQLTGAALSQRIRSGFEVALVGAPNAGKSTLLNAIAGRPVALISEIPGTTRDILEVPVDLRGIPVTMLDTAGMRDGGDVVERLGIDRARDRAGHADLRVFLRMDPAEAPPLDLDADDIVVRAKGDLRDGGGLSVSGLTGTGVDKLLQRVADVLEGRVAEASMMTRERHRVAAERAVEALLECEADLAEGVERLEFSAAALDCAVRHLDVLVGRIGVEDALGDVFSRFCIGK